MDDADRLAALARALDEAGWTTRIPVTELSPRLRVFSPLTPGFGDSVWITHQAETPWFCDSTGKPLRPCNDIAGAVQMIGERMELIASASICNVDNPPPGLADRLRHMILGSNDVRH